MVHQMPDIKAVMGREVRVLCPASGYPLENILWSKGEIYCPGSGYPPKNILSFYGQKVTISF